jgi:hypothetical protein
VLCKRLKHEVLRKTEAILLIYYNLYKTKPGEYEHDLYNDDDDDNNNNSSNNKNVHLWQRFRS